MVDSGIKTTQEVIDAMWSMSEIAKSKYDFVVININQVPTKGNKIDFEMVVEKIQENGEAEKKYEGQDLKEEDAVFKAVKEILLSEYKDDTCFVQFYLNYSLEGNRPQHKLILLSWIPETTPIKKKMVMASTCKTLLKKAPHGVLGYIVNDLNDIDFKELSFVASAGKSK